MPRKTAKPDLILPVLPMRDTVVFPNIVTPLFVGRTKSTQALTMAMDTAKQILLLTQKTSKKEDPTGEDLYTHGTVANILQMVKLPEGAVKILVEGVRRGVAQEIQDHEDLLTAKLKYSEEIYEPSRELEALVRTVINQFEEYINLNSKIPNELAEALVGIADPGRLADTIAMHLPLSVQDAQLILETLDVEERLEKVLRFLKSELDILQMERKIDGRVKVQMEKGQKEYYLHEKIKAIKKELGEAEEKDRFLDELAKLKKRIKTAGMSKEAEERAFDEWHKLELMPPMSAEGTVCRNYIDWLLDIPWKEKSKVNKDLKKAEEILEEDHYGLEKIKERIVEYLAVQHKVKKVKGPILCLVGPPGVGKTSLGESIARATGRKFVRISLGGVRDEAEIRGHRRTYIGSMPGKILQKMAKVKVRNPLFMLDEIDKMSMDFRGDPSSALLEVLDPEQNHSFNDHYLEVDYDLTDVMFICTANTLDIPYALMDRMEILPLEGYTEDEKLNIAEKYIIPKQLKENGLKPKEINFATEAVIDIVRYYTREAGVRGVERMIAKICRKVVREILLKKVKKQKSITPAGLEKYLGVRPYRFGLAEKHDQVGQVTGLAWTEVGGDLLTVEVAVVAGKGNATYTGSLGDVMLESIQAAITVVRSRADKLGISKDFYAKSDIHVHVPEGAIPKDGPSAGISMCTALVSALTKNPVRADVAMTGEITLRGEVLPIGGLKEKLLAALRGGIKTVIIPQENEKYLKELPKNITKDLDIRPVKWIDEVLEIALCKKLRPKKVVKKRK